MKGRAVSLVFVSMLILGCAKQPATMTASAPAPSGVATATPMPGGSDSTQQGTQPGMTTMRPGDQQGDATASGGRPAPSEFTTVRDLVDVYFDFDKYDIRPRDAEILSANARWLRANPNTAVLIEGHCDARGTDEYNLSLGDRRAKSVVAYLTAQGIAPTRLVTISYGKERPQCSENSEACWAKNRRAHFLVKRT